MNKTKILIINGPNLNLLGSREKDIYGDQDFLSYLDELKKQHKDCEISYLQSNHEGEIIDKIHASRSEKPIILINAGAYTHTSIAIADAIVGVDAEVIEVHISNIYEREQFRHHSYISAVSKYSIVGKGLQGYQDAISAALIVPSNIYQEILVHGKVQGVWFRYNTQKEAKKLKISGTVSNSLDGTVHVKAMGAAPNMETFIAYLQVGPEHAQVTKTKVSHCAKFDCESFEII